MLHRHEVARVIGAQRVREAFDDLNCVALNPLYPHGLFLIRIWALRHTLTADDATYVALAETLQVTLVTCHTCLATSGDHRATITRV